MSEFSVAVSSARDALSLMARGRGARRQLRPIHSASAVKWQAEPKPSKLHLLTSPVQSRESAPHLSLDTAELASPFAIFAEDSTKDEFFMTSHLPNPLFLSHRMRQNQESLERDDFYANMGSAIRVLREETPVLFYQDLNYSIYREDITFRDPRNTFTGIDKYRLIFWALRFHGKMFFKAIWVEVLRIWQPSDRVIAVRWTVRGIPRVPWEAQGRFEGTSEYKLDENGKIYEHKVDNVAPNNPSYFRAPALMDLLPSSPYGTPTPTFCKRTTLPLWELIITRGSTWERFYIALTTTLDMHHWWVWYLAA